MTPETNTGVVVVFGPRRSHAQFQANSYMARWNPESVFVNIPLLIKGGSRVYQWVYLATARLASCIRFLAPYLLCSDSHIMITCNHNVHPWKSLVDIFRMQKCT